MAGIKIPNDSLLEYFTCPVCFEYMNNKIYICTNGHSVCGGCQNKISKCPICMIKLDSKRNITLEKAAKKFKELKVKQDEVETGNFMSLKRKQRFSLGSAIPDRTEENLFGNIQCPIPKCCYSTKHLMQLKIHLSHFHTDQLIALKKGPSIVSEDLMRITVNFDPFTTRKICLVTITDAIFVIYIAMSSASRACHYLNVVTVSDTSSMYKFTCKNTSKFSMFYKGQHQAEEGIEIDSNTLDIVRNNTCSVPKYSISVHIQKVASLHR